MNLEIQNYIAQQSNDDIAICSILAKVIDDVLIKAESNPDFIHKLAIAQKEANEAEYWIELLYQSEYLDKQQYESIFQDITEIRKLLTSIIKTSKLKKT